MLKAWTSGKNQTVPAGNNGITIRKKPYPPNFNSKLASITDPSVGACTCASGSHLCTGIIGILTAKPRKKSPHKYIWPAGAIL